MVPAIRKPPQQERSRKVEKALLRVGLRGIEKRGIAALSMTGVAAEAGTSIGSLYLRFGDKSQFIGAVLAMALDEFRDRTFTLCDLAARRKWTERRVLKGWVGMLVDLLRSRRVLVREMISHLAAQPYSWDPIHGRRREMEDRLFSVLSTYRDRNHAQQMRLRIGLQSLMGALIHMVVVDPGPLRIDDRSVKSTLCDLLFSFIRVPNRQLERRSSPTQKK